MLGELQTRKSLKQSAFQSRRKYAAGYVRDIDTLGPSGRHGPPDCPAGLYCYCRAGDKGLCHLIGGKADVRSRGHDVDGLQR